MGIFILFFNVILNIITIVYIMKVHGAKNIIDIRSEIQKQDQIFAEATTNINKNLKNINLEILNIHLKSVAHQLQFYTSL